MYVLIYFAMDKLLLDAVAFSVCALSNLNHL